MATSRFRQVADSDYEIGQCGASVWEFPRGQEVQFNARVRNHRVGDQAGIVGDLVVEVGGAEVARNNDAPIGPDRWRWLNATGIVDVPLGEHNLEIRYQNVRSRHG